MYTVRTLVGAVALACWVSSAAAQGISISPLNWMKGNLTSGAAREMQQSPAIAWGGQHYLVAWSDSRSKVPSEFGAQTEDDIYAARLDASGKLVDAVSIPIATGPGYQRNPQVAWNGTHWLVAWVNQTYTGSYYQSRIFATRVASDGTVLDVPFQVLPQGSGYTMYFSLASNGPNWCVVTQSDSGGGLVGGRISPQGTPLDPGGIVLIKGTYYLYFYARIASAGGEYLLLYNGNAGNKAQRFDAVLQAIGSEFGVPGLSLGSNGASYYMAWSDGSGLVGSPMARDGTLSFPAGVQISSSGVGVNDLGHSSWDGSNWWLGWNQLQAPKAARITPSGQVLDAGGIDVDPTHSTYTYSVTLAGSALGGAQVAWTDGRVELWDVYGANLTPGGQAGPAGPLTFSAAPERRPKLAAGPSGEWLAVAVSEFSGLRRILAWRLNDAGQALDPEPILVASGADATTPSVAFDGVRYLIVWAQSGNVLARRMTHSGSFQDPVPIAVMPGWTPDVSALNGVFLIVAANAPIYPQYVSAFGRRLDGATAALLDASPLSLTNSYVRALDVTTFGARWLVAVQRNFTHDDPQSGVEALFVEPDGAVGTTISVVFAGGGAPALAVSQSRAIVAYRTGSISSANNDLAARILNADGSFATAPFSVSTAFGAGWAKQFAPAAAWNGSNFVLAWEDQRNQLHFFDARSDIYAARVTPNGIVLDPSAFALANTADPECYPTLAAQGNKVLFAASIMRTSAPFAAYRMGTRTIVEGCTAPQTYCTAMTSSHGCLPAMGWSGAPSLSNPVGFVVTASSLESQLNGLMFFGLTGRDSQPFFGGILCVAGPLYRLPVQNTLGAAACTGALSMNLADFLAHPSGGSLVIAGATVDCQVWTRDPPAATTVNLSGGLEFVVCP